MRVIGPLASAIVALALVAFLALLVANDALGRQRCLADMGRWNSGPFGGHCGVR